MKFKKGKLTLAISIGLVCFLLTSVIFIQVKTISQTNITSIENMRDEEVRAEITKYKTRVEELDKKISETETKIEEYTTSIKSNDENSTLLENELKQSENLLGITDISGSGIIVTLSDTKEAQITADDLLTLLNQLKQAGAEAISINDQRIVYNSYVTSINNTYITVNGKRIVAPFVVKAIGNSKYLESGLSTKQYGYIDTKTAEGKSVTLEQKDNITIYKYSNELKFEYAKEVN